jgi:hypothetical protein
MGQPQRKLNMYDPAVFCIRIQGELDEAWSRYFGARSVTVEVDKSGAPVTNVVTEPVDQAALVGLINYLNGCCLPVMSVECLLME